MGHDMAWTERVLEMQGFVEEGNMQHTGMITAVDGAYPLAMSATMARASNATRIPTTKIEGPDEDEDSLVGMTVAGDTVSGPGEVAPGEAGYTMPGSYQDPIAHLGSLTRGDTLQEEGETPTTEPIALPVSTADPFAEGEPSQVSSPSTNADNATASSEQEPPLPAPSDTNPFVEEPTTPTRAAALNPNRERRDPPPHSRRAKSGYAPPRELVMGDDPSGGVSDDDVPPPPPVEYHV